MQDDYYSDADAPVGAPMSKGEDADKSNDGDEKMDQKTSILPKEFFGGEVKPGDTCTIRVEGVHEDSVEVSYEGPGEEMKPEDKAEAPESAEPQAGSMSSMLED